MDQMKGGAWKYRGWSWRAASAVLALLVAVPSAAITAARAEEPKAWRLEIEQRKRATRIVIELSKSVDYKAFVLGNPYRLVIDLPVVTWRGDAAPGRAAGPIMAWRYGKFTDSRARLVFDLDRPMLVARAELDAASSTVHRLIVDLEHATRDEFARRAGTDNGAAPNYTSPSDDNRKAADDGKSLPLLVLDPGHGGIDPGSTGPSGIHEKDLILLFAKDLQDLLVRSGRYRVMLTRNGDYYIALRQRFEMARAAQATLFVSLHVDASPFRADRGISVYTLSNRASDDVAAELAKRENRSDAVAGVNLAASNERVAGILVDLAQRQSMLQAARLAGRLLPELKRVGVLVPGQAHRSAGFAVLKAPDIPSVLIEVGHLSNPKEEKQLQDPAYRIKLSAGIMRGIDIYLAERDRAAKPRETKSAER